MNTSPPSLSLWARSILGKTAILPDCAASKALFEFLGKQHVFPEDLPRLAKIGFQIQILGRIEPINKVLHKEQQPHSRIKNELRMHAQCPSCGTVLQES